MPKVKRPRPKPSTKPAPRKGTRLARSFFTRSVLDVAPDLVGKILCRKCSDGVVLRRRIVETEAYNGASDSACHARFGKTERNSSLYLEGGHVYVFLCYGVHNMLNLVTGQKDLPEAVLIRGVDGADGPGKLTKLLSIDRSHDGLDMMDSDVIWVEDDGVSLDYECTKRIGIDYASEKDRNRLWRYIAHYSGSNSLSYC